MTAKPLTGPEPNINSIKEAIKVVILASKIVTIDFLNPKSKACMLEFSLFNSSLILSKLKHLHLPFQLLK